MIQAHDRNDDEACKILQCHQLRSPAHVSSQQHVINGPTIMASPPVVPMVTGTSVAWPYEQKK